MGTLVKGELYKELRPQDFETVVGQEAAVAMLTGFIKRRAVPQTIAFHGPSGTGKTTLARILARKIGCNPMDLAEINCADARGIDMARDIRRLYTLAPMGGRCRVWILDEFHKTTNDAQNAFLKMMEDTPKKVYFMLCTTEPGKIIPTIRSRCTMVALKPLSGEDMEELLNSAATVADFTLTPAVMARIVEVANGGARAALVALNSILEVEDEAEQLATIERGDPQTEAFALAKALMFGRGGWAEVSNLIKTIEGEPESIRRMILAFATTCLLGGAGKKPTMPDKAADIIHIFRNPIYDTGKAATAILAQCCYDAVKTGKK